MILNSYTTRPQSCRVRSLGRPRGAAQKQTTHQETKTKLSSATPNRDKTVSANAKTISFLGREHIGFLNSKWSSPDYLHNVKSLAFRASRKVPHCQKWDCHATAFRFRHGYVFLNFYFIAGKTKNGRAKSTLWIAFWSPNSKYLSNPKMGMKHARSFFRRRLCGFCQVAAQVYSCHN